MEKFVMLSVVLILASGLIFSSCGESKAPHDTLTVVRDTFGSESTDPIVYDSIWGWSLFDPLVTWDKGGNYIGAVAESWELSEDGNTWTFHIRKGMMFHNGDTVTAHDVKFCVDRFASEESTNPWSPYLRANLDYTEVTDDYTFVYHSNTSEPSLIISFASTRIYSENYFEEVGQDGFRAHPIGSGPWKFVEHIPETSFKMEAFTGHWRQVPAYQYLIDLQVPEEMTRIAMLKNGDADIALAISTDRIVHMMEEGWRTETFGLPSLFNISFTASWLENKPTSDIRVRKAMSYAINRQELCDTFYLGLARPGGRFFMHEGTWGWDPSWQPDPYDLDLARDLLVEAGYPESFDTPTIVYYATAGINADLAQILQAYWAEVGIDVQIEIVDLANWASMFLKRDVTPGSPIAGAIFPFLGSSVFDNIYHSANMYTTTGVHSTSNDPEADRLYHEAIETLDNDLRKQRWTAFQEYVYDEMFINCPIVIIEPLVLMGPNVGEVTTNTHISIFDAYAGIQHP